MGEYKVQGWTVVGSSIKIPGYLPLQLESSAWQPNSPLPFVKAVRLLDLALAHLLVLTNTVRDNWENKKADFEEKLSSILGVPWTFNYDTNGLYKIAVDSGLSGEPISDPGSMYAK